METRALELIRDEMDRFCQDGISEEELSCAREQIKSNVVLALESTTTRMNRMGSAILLTGKCLTADEVLARYDAVTAGDVLRMARERLTPENLGFSALGRIAPVEEYLHIFREK